MHRWRLGKWEGWSGTNVEMCQNVLHPKVKKVSILKAMVSNCGKAVDSKICGFFVGWWLFGFVCLFLFCCTHSMQKFLSQGWNHATAVT